MLERKNNIIKVLFFTIILFLTSISQVKCYENNPIFSSDFIDQEQTKADSTDFIYKNNWKAQSFRPTEQVLTRIQIYVKKLGEISSDIEIFIRNSINGNNLVNYSIKANTVSYEPSWLDFNIADINVSVDQPYYILCKTNSGDEDNCYVWYQGIDNPYENGIKYYSNNNGTSWNQEISYDFCFKTFATFKKSSLKIAYFRGGPGGKINFGIKNTGEGIIKNIKVDLEVRTGLIFFGGSITKNYNTYLKPGSNDIFEASMYPIIAIGPTRINISVTSPYTENVSKDFNAFHFIFYIYVIK